MSSPTNPQSLMREMGLNDVAFERRRAFVELSEKDTPRLKSIEAVVHANAAPMADAFFEYLRRFDEARAFLGNRESATRARRMKEEHFRLMTGGEYGRTYVEHRVELALLYSRGALDPRVFLGAFHHTLRQFGTAILKASPGGAVEPFESFMALKKVAFFDIGIILDVVAFERERMIRQQQEAIRELSTPVLQIRDRLLLLPIIGLIDTHRARLITESLLHAIRANRARVVVVDVTGVATIDSKVANHLLQTVAAARLMGARVLVTGLSAEVAQSLVALGIDLGTLDTYGDLQGGLEEASKLLAHVSAELAKISTTS